MSAANPGHEAHEPSSAPVARISASAIARNAYIAIASLPVGTRAVADLRADAWGHGAPVVAAELLAAGVDRLLVDDVPAARLLTGAGARGATTTELPDLDSLTLYGLPGGALDATPAMRLSGTVLSVKRLRRGEGVSYGYTFRATSDTRVALVTGGYAQGVVRALGNRVDVTIAGRRHPIVGRVAMDVCVVDIDAHEVQRGAEAVFFGDPRHGEPSVSEWMDASGLGAGELVTAVGLRATREHTA
ncbi:alanine racemase C-terminal domain-containing protein [Microbacterium sp. CFBP9034]|uniref:alanine racemase C-terminal domain-containing protein n=1 Tax=Microbacterium sp. CFBP9034 TaxID=3096540 RepID=UPI002A69B266|nr:alanine racemase C-terminal domain-containing protein [Microbacterium sp. CFBP9034]MDY0909717.1 alanine racemase C-terminal domain-containing protein [Microbacterium sp. CFBP9034]